MHIRKLSAFRSRRQQTTKAHAIDGSRLETFAYGFGMVWGKLKHEISTLYVTYHVKGKYIPIERWRGSPAEGGI